MKLARGSCQGDKCFSDTAVIDCWVAAEHFGPAFFQQHYPNLIVMRSGISKFVDIMDFLYVVLFKGEAIVSDKGSPFSVHE